MKRVAKLVFLLLFLIVLASCFARDIELRFNSNGGSDVESIILNDGFQIADLEIPFREGYDFLGWYIDPNFSEPFLNANNLKRSITLYAKWEELSELELYLRNIYTLAFESNAFMGTYEEWLDSVRGPKGEDAKNIEFKVIDGYIGWNYIGNTNFNNLVSLLDITGNDGREVEFLVVDNYIKWKYTDSDTYISLISLDVLRQGPKGDKGDKGDTGENIELRVSSGYIQYSVKGTNQWNNLIDIKSLTGAQGSQGPKGDKGDPGLSGPKGNDGDQITLRASGNFIQWKLGNEVWKNLIELTTLTRGADGRQIELSIKDGFIVWNYVGESNYNDLIDIETLKGTSGREVEFNKTETHISWRYKGDIDWEVLIDLVTLKGDAGRSAYEIYLEYYPEYNKTEEDWINDLINGRLKEKENIYLVQYVNEDGFLLHFEYVKEGEDAKGFTPKDIYGYEFIGWNQELDNIKYDLRVEPVYKKSIYLITFIDQFYNIIDIQEVLKGEDAENIAKPLEEGMKYFYREEDLENIIENKTIDVIYIPDYYVLATDNDFEGQIDGEFVYIGDADYVIIPEYIKGIKITKTASSFNSKSLFNKRTNIKGVVFEKYYNIIDMTSLFSNNISNKIELQFLNTSSVENMSGMFFDSRFTTFDLSNFDTSNVTNMKNMFAGTHVSSLDLSSFNTINVIDMSYMFSGSHATSLNLNNFNTTNVENMSWMFNRTKNMELNINGFDTSRVTNMNGMFAESKTVVLNIENFDTSNVTSMRSMFAGSQATSLDLRNFNTKSVTDMSYMFEDLSAETIDLSSFDISNLVNSVGMFLNSNIQIGYAKSDFEANYFNDLIGKAVFIVDYIKIINDDIKTLNILEYYGEDSIIDLPKYGKGGTIFVWSYTNEYDEINNLIDLDTGVLTPSVGEVNLLKLTLTASFGEEIIVKDYEIFVGSYNQTLIINMLNGNTTNRSMVKIVGVIVEKISDSRYTLDDGTGLISISLNIFAVREQFFEYKIGDEIDLFGMYSLFNGEHQISNITTYSHKKIN